MTVLRTAPARSGSSEHSVVPSFDCLFFRVTLLAVHHLNLAPRLVPHRKTLSQIEHEQPAGPASARAPLCLPLVLGAPSVR
jgi:hypothetical protein